MIHTRVAEARDAEVVSALIAAYVTEHIPGTPGATPEQLRRDVLVPQSSTRIMLAERGGHAAGLLAWSATYDLHWGVKGAQVEGLYVDPGSRGHGVALRLIAAVCAEAEESGAVFIRACNFDRSSPAGHLYERIAIATDTAECTCGGRAFRRLAELHGAPVRQMVRSLPPREWNFES